MAWKHTQNLPISKRLLFGNVLAGHASDRPFLRPRMDRMQQGAMDGGAATKLRKAVRYILPLGISSSAIAPALL